MCKKGAQIFQRQRSKVENLAAQRGPSMTKKNDDNDSRHITSILLWKMVGYTPSSFADLVLTDERIKAGMKRGKFNYSAWTNQKN